MNRDKVPAAVTFLNALGEFENDWPVAFHRFGIKRPHDVRVIAIATPDPRRPRPGILHGHPVAVGLVVEPDEHMNIIRPRQPHDFVHVSEVGGIRRGRVVVQPRTLAFKVRAGPAAHAGEHDHDHGESLGLGHDLAVAEHEVCMMPGLIAPGKSSRAGRLSPE